MTWIFKFEAPKGLRILRYGCAVDVKDEPHLWCNQETGRWTKTPDFKTASHSSSSHIRVRTFKAFKRYLRNHPELKGYTVRWCTLYRDHDVMAKWREE